MKNSQPDEKNVKRRKHPIRIFLHGYFRQFRESAPNILSYEKTFILLQNVRRNLCAWNQLEMNRFVIDLIFLYRMQCIFFILFSASRIDMEDRRESAIYAIMNDEHQILFFDMNRSSEMFFILVLKKINWIICLVLIQSVLFTEHRSRWKER